MLKRWIVFLLIITLPLMGVASLEGEETGSRILPRVGEDQNLYQSKTVGSFTHLLQNIEAHAQVFGSGFSYVNIIPYVTKENGMRTNLGLNNFSENSFLKGANPNANVFIALVDQQGNFAGFGSFVVRTHELLQINDIISALGGNIGTGWVLITSDEPLTAWASVIFNFTNDPSIELAIPLQLLRPPAFTEGQPFGVFGNRLLIQSSVKSAAFQSSLVVLNIGPSAGNFTIKIYNHTGQLIETKSVFIRSFGMYVNDDIRSSVNGTFGQIVIESNNDSLVLIANCVVKSTTGTGAFFPAFLLPPSDKISLAGIWEGSLSGGITSAQVKVTLREERNMVYGTLEIVSGSFPTTTKRFLISGEVSPGSKIVLQIQDSIDGDSPLSYLSFRLFGQIDLNGARLVGDTLYIDQQRQQNVGTFSLSRTRSIFGQ